MIQADQNRNTLTVATAMPRPTISSIAGVPMTDSRDVAAYFGRSHKNVLQALANAQASCSPDFARLNFQPVHFEGRTRLVLSHYLLTKDAFAFAVLGFTGQQAAQFKESYIGAFNAMEAELRARQAPAVDLDDPATLRRLLLGKLDRIDVLEAQVEKTSHALAIAHEVIEQDAPKIEAYDMLVSDRGTLCLADAARHIGARQEDFFKWIRSSGLVFEKNGDTYPAAEYRLDGQFVVKLTPLPSGLHRAQTRVTKQGLVWLTHKWQAHLIVVAREAERARIQGELKL